MSKMLIFLLIAITVMGISFFNSGVDRNYLRVTGYYSNSDRMGATVGDTLLVIPVTTMDGRQTYRQMAIYGWLRIVNHGSSPIAGDTLKMLTKPFYGDSAVWMLGDVTTFMHTDTITYFFDTLNVPVCDSVLFTMDMNSANPATDSVIGKYISWRLYNPDE